MKTHKLPILILLIPVMLSVLLLSTGCTEVRVYWSVRTFARDLGTVLVQTYQPKPNFAAKLPAALRKQVEQRNDDHELLIAAYEPTGYTYRFVRDHLPTIDHEQLTARLEKIRGEGIDPSLYEIDRAKTLAQNLIASKKHLDSLLSQGLTLSDEETVALRSAVKQAGASDLSPMGILAFASDPANQGQFPILRKLITKTAELAAARDHAEMELELLDAVNFFRLAQEMGLADDDLPTAWEESRGNMSATLKKMIPLNPHYPHLIAELARYRKLAQQGEQHQFNTRRYAKVGSKGELVLEVQRHLQMTGYWEGALDGEFTEQFKEAVIKFQDNHQLTPHGRVDRTMLKVLNRSFAERLKWIKLALHKLRFSVARGEEYFVWVNVAGQQLEVFDENGAKVLRKHRLVVGNRISKNHTPLFSDEIEKIIYYPPWNVPERIIREEMVPQYEENPEYFKKRGYSARIVGEGEEARVVAVTQPPGRGNALGIVKILFPNQYAVYLHDTPSKHLFKRPIRSYSHGCLRLHNALDLAKFLLEQDGNEHADQVDEILKKFRTTEILLNKWVPIHIEYITVSSDDEGLAVFFSDIYKLDTDALAEMSAD